MISNRVAFLKGENLYGKLTISFIALCIGGPILLGLWKISLGILFLAALLFYFKRVEELFLLWLLTFSFFALDSLAFLKIETHPILNYDRVFILIMLIIFLKEIVLKERKLIPINSIDIIFILFLFVIAFSIATKTDNKLMGLRYFIDSFLLPFIIYFLAKNFISSRKYFNKFITVLFIVGIYISIMGGYEFFSRRDLFHDPVYGGLRIVNEFWIRVNGPYVGDYTFGFCAAICFFIALYKYIISIKSNRFRNLFYICILGMITIAICFTLYRGILLALVLGLLTFFIIRRKGFIKMSFLVIALVLFIIPFVNKIRSSELYYSRIANIKTVQDRFDRYNYALYLFRKNPIYGIGFRNYRMFSGDTGQHNQIITMISETGLLGTSIYIILFYLLFYHGIKRYKSSNDYFEKQFSIIYLSILVVYLIFGLSDNSGFDKYCNLLFFAISGVALSGTKKL